nr:hypothetical protein [uncultured Desulfobacter sp.]
MESEKNNQIEQSIVQQYFDQKKYMPLLPLLEKPLSDIKNIYSFIEEQELIDLVNYALDWKSKDYWQSLSVEWIESGIPITETILKKLEEISNDKGYSQKLRHKVKRLRKNES